MMEAALRNMIDSISAIATLLVGRLMALAIGPELRVTYAIARAAKLARKRSGKW